VAALVAIALATLTPADDPRAMSRLTPLLCLVCGDQGGADVVANLLLFIPFTLGLRLSGRSWARCVAAAAGLSFTVELLQLVAIPGRDASLSDLLANTVSGGLGAGLGGILPAVITPRPRQAAQLLAGSLGAAAGLLAVSAWLLSPATPPGVLLSRWAHVAPATDVFGGRVGKVTLNGRAMPSDGTPADSARLRREVDGGLIRLDAEVLSGPVVAPRSWIYMFRVPSGEAVTLSQIDRLAVFAVPSRSLRFKLWPPTVMLPDGLPAVSGVPVRLQAMEQHRRLALSSFYDGRTRTIRLGVSPAYGWIMIVSFVAATGSRVRWVTGLCLLLLFFPAGYWGAWTARPALAALAVCAGLAGAVGGVAWAAGFPAPHWSEWVAATAGGALGWALGRAAAYLQTRCASPSASEFSSS
jgi:VanZ like protein